MAINKQTSLGKINITTKAIVSLVADATLECYGVVAICEKDPKTKVAKRDDFSKMIIVKEEKDGYEISFAMVVTLGVKVTEILRSVQKKVKYVVENTFDVRVAKVNIFVQDLEKVQ